MFAKEPTKIVHIAESNRIVNGWVNRISELGSKQGQQIELTMALRIIGPAVDIGARNTFRQIEKRNALRMLGKQLLNLRHLASSHC